MIEHMFDKVTTTPVSELEQMAPGVELAAVLAAIEYSDLSPHELVSVLRAQQRQVSHYQAASYWTMSEIVTAYDDPESDS